MISIIVILILVIFLLLIARRSSKNRDAILIEIILGIAGSVAAAVAVASFPKTDASHILGYLDSRMYDAIFGGKGGEAPGGGQAPSGGETKDGGEVAIAVQPKPQVRDRKLDGVYAGLVRSVQNGSDVLSEKAYVLRMDSKKNQKVLEIYQDGAIEYKIRIDGQLQKDGVTWVGETKSVLQGGAFVQDALKLLVSPEVGRIDWLQHDKVQHVESIGTLYRIDEDIVSERISATNRIKNNIFICNEEGAKTGGSAGQFLFVPVESRAGPNKLSLEGPRYAGKLFTEIIAGYAKPYEGPYETHFKTGFKSSDFPDLTGMNMLKPDLSSLAGLFGKDYTVGVNRSGETVNWFKETLGASEPCRVFFAVFPPGPEPSVTSGAPASPEADASPEPLGSPGSPPQ